MAYKLKLTKEQYDKLVHLYTKCGWSVRQLEARFGVPKSTIHRIVRDGVSYEVIDSDASK